ncbi:hypothetical protein EMIT0P2_10373 [Pseudomonas sp. IT-P2]
MTWRSIWPAIGRRCPAMHRRLLKKICCQPLVEPDLLGSFNALPSLPSYGILRTHFPTRPRIAARKPP